MKGIFISFEGCEGSGKTTLIKKIKSFLEEKNKKFIVTREPGGSDIAEQIRKVILDVNNTSMDENTEALLYAASRRQHLVEKVIPYLKQGYIVLCDRYIDSSLAYQGWARNIGIKKVLDVNLFATSGLLPDRTIYVDVPPEVGLKRISSNNRHQNRLDKETISFHKKVYEGYEEVKKMFPDRVVSINGNQEEDKVFKDAIEKIKEII